MNIIEKIKDRIFWYKHNRIMKRIEATRHAKASNAGFEGHGTRKRRFDQVAMIIDHTECNR